MIQFPIKKSLAAMSAAFGLVITAMVLREGMPAVKKPDAEVAGPETSPHLRVTSRPASESAEPALAGRVLKLLNGDSLNQERRLVDAFEDWLSRDETAAWEFVKAMEPGLDRDLVTRCLMDAWAARDPHRALEAALAFQDSSQSSIAASYLCSKVAENDPAEALRLAISFEPAEQPVITESIALKWANQDWPAAQAWIARQEAGETRDLLYGRLAFVKSQTNPAEAARLVSKQIPPGPVPADAVISVLHQWGLSDLAAAGEWIRLFPTGPVRERAEAELEGIQASRRLGD